MTKGPYRLKEIQYIENALFSVSLLFRTVAIFARP